MTAPRHARRSTAPYWMILGAWCLVGCASVQRQGDRAFDRGDCAHALQSYEEAIAEGAKDAGMFHRAAQCALKAGDLSGAERYYSHAMRYGAGIDVAQELAGFYVSTSNYVSAVRVYQYLLYQESEKQQIYNNLGTALMYAGKPFDAESYLMIAQQMNPGDPTPYVNLGLLYDRHLKQPWLAINFYECYDELTNGRAKNSMVVRQRASELRERYYRLYIEGAVACGKAYQPAMGTVVSLDSLKDPEPAEVPTPPEVVADTDTTPVGDAPVIERQVTEEDPPDEVATALAGLQRARAAYTEGRWADAVGGFTSLPLSQLQVADQKALGIAYQKQANWAMAGHWLELALTTNDDQEILLALVDVYKRTTNESRIAGLCKRYGTSRKYEKILSEHCSTAND